MNTIDLLFENTKIKGKVILSDSLHENKALLKDKTLYKFIWVLSGQLELDVDHQPVVLKEGQLLTLSHLHHVDFVRVDGEYLSLLFNSNFYCIYGNDHEVSCNGLLFHGSSHVVIFDLSGEERRKIATLTGIMREEFESRDHLQDEMLRVLLKRFIILCTRIAENRQGVRKENGMQFETIRKFYVLVDTHFKEKKQVQEYADMLNKSPKTLANLLSTYQQPSAIRVIHNRVQAEADAATGLFALVNNITEAVRAEFRPAGAAAPLAALWYPAYWEDIEETPAHILLHTFSGQGYHYRQCFLNNKFLPAEYDAIFPQGHDADDANIMAMLCFDRLRWPWQLSETAAGHYRAFLSANTGRVLTRLLKAQDLDGVRALLALDVLDKAAFAEGAALAAKAENAAAAALLADAEHKKFAAAKPKRRYDFDF